MQILIEIALGAAAALAAVLALRFYWHLRWGPPPAGSIPVLAYHKVDTRFELGGTWVTPRQFERQMRWLKEDGWRTVTMTQAAEMMSSGTAEAKTVCLTFDDAYQGLHRYALPILQKMGFTATVFVVTDYVGAENTWDLNWGGRRFRHLDWDQMKEMQRAGIEFGSHGASHRDLRSLADQDLRRELAGSKKSLEEGLGAEVAAFCYPFGRYDQRVRRAVIEAGYKCACSHSPNRPNNMLDLYAMRRCGVYITDIRWDYKHKVDQKSSWFWIQDLWSRMVNFCAGGTIMARRVLHPRGW